MGRAACAAFTACAACPACAACAACAVFTACALWFLPKCFRLIGTYANLVGLICRQICRQLLIQNRFRSCPIFIDRDCIPTDGHRHIDGSCFCINIITEAGVFPGFASVFLRLLLVDLYGVAIRLVCCSPTCLHDLIAYRGQCDVCRRFWFLIVRIRNCCAKLLTIDGSKSGYFLTILRSPFFLCQKDGGDIIVSARHVRAACRYGNLRYWGIAARTSCYVLLVYQVGRFALFRAQVGAQGVFHIWFRILDLTAEGVVVCSAL